MKTLKITAVMVLCGFVGGAFAQQGPPQQFLPGPGGQVPMMQPQNPAMMGGGYQPQMVSEHPPVPSGCGTGRNDYTRIVNQGGAPTPVLGGGNHQ